MIERIIAPLFSLYFIGCTAATGVIEPAELPGEPQQECTQEQQINRLGYLHTLLNSADGNENWPCNGPGEIIKRIDTADPCNPKGRLEFRCTEESHRTEVPTAVGPTITVHSLDPDKGQISYK